MTPEAAAVRHEMHLGIAEAGKMHALARRHAEALRHYREAMRLAVAAKAPEVFFRHYLQCTLESLEQMESYAEVIRFCAEAEAHYERTGHPLALHRRDHAAILERLGLVRLKAGADGAEDALRRAVALAGPGALPLAEETLGWLARRLTPTPARIAEAQRRRRYFTVRPGQVDPARARPLPPDAGGAQPAVAAFAPGG
jgi:tetratricopeptide (TPR) repeat protein